MCSTTAFTNFLLQIESMQFGAQAQTETLFRHNKESASRLQKNQSAVRLDLVPYQAPLGWEHPSIAQVQVDRYPYLVKCRIAICKYALLSVIAINKCVRHSDLNQRRNPSPIELFE
ncbi:hypothetical protein Droror1_Dr00011417 [Drosera rotundifolia]